MKPEANRSSTFSTVFHEHAEAISTSRFFKNIWRYMSAQKQLMPGRIDDSEATKLIAENFWLSLTMQNRNGDLAQHELLFRDFLDGDERFLMFAADLRTDEALLGDLKSRQARGNLIWTFGKQQQAKQVHLGGALSVIMPPTRFHPAHPPRGNSLLNGINAEDQETYWQDVRRCVWDGLSPQLRARWVFNDAADRKTALLPPQPEITDVNDEKQKAAEQAWAGMYGKMHDAAFEHFVVIVFRAETMTSFDRTEWPIVTKKYYNIGTEHAYLSPMTPMSPSVPKSSAFRDNSKKSVGFSKPAK